MDYEIFNQADSPGDEWPSREVLYGALEPEELAIVQKALDLIAEAFTT